MRFAISYALKNDSESLTLVHKGNVLKFTDGALSVGGLHLHKTSLMPPHMKMGVGCK